MFESTNQEVVDNYNPLSKMEIGEKIALWERILSSTHFVDKQMYNARPNESTTMQEASESELYSYAPRRIHYGNKEQTRYTMFCQAETRGSEVKNDYHIFYAYRKNSYFIGEPDSSKTKIILIGLAEPKAVQKLYESQETLEESFLIGIGIANQMGIRTTSPSNSPTKKRKWRLFKLKNMDRVRLCGQVFGSEFYRNKEIKFVGQLKNVVEYKFPLLVSFRSEPFRESKEVYEYMFGCIIMENGVQRVYFISNSYDLSDEDLAVYVLWHNDKEDKQFLDSRITAVTVLMPTEPVRRSSVHH